MNNFNQSAPFIPSAPQTGSNQPPVPHELDRLNDAVSRVLTAVTKLEDKLSSVTTYANEVAEKASAPMPQPAPFKCQLASELACRVDELHGVEEQVNKLTSRIEL